jgi:hypothetical protein
MNKYLVIATLISFIAITILVTKLLDAFMYLFLKLFIGG